MPKLSLNELSYSVENRSVLDNISGTIEAGQSVAIFGASGRGKTILLRLVLALLQPQSGYLALDDVPYSQLTAGERTKIRRRLFASVQQTPSFFPSLTARQNVALALNLRGAPREQRRQRRFLVSQALDRFMVLHLAERTIDDLSNGEKQRVALARAFVGAPPIICVDEPNVTGDPNREDEVINAIFREHRRANSTILIATQNEGLMARCDRVFDMNWMRWDR